jgi:hypothetical protein
VLLISVAGLRWYLKGDPSPSASTLEAWVQAQRYEPLRPMRSSYLPGTLVYISPGGHDRVAMAARDFLDMKADAVLVGRVPDVTLDVRYVFDAKTAVGTTKGADAHASGGTGLQLKARLNLRGLDTLTLPLDKVRDLVADNERVRAAVRESPDNLYIVLDALRVKRIEFSFTDQAGASVDATLPEKLLKPMFAANLTFGADGMVVSDAPIVVGASLGKLSEVSTVLGGSSTPRIAVTPVAPEEVGRFRRTAAAQTSRLYTGFDVYGLAIGLGNYPISSARAGGLLPDAAATSEYVAKAWRRLLPPAAASRIRTITSEELSPGRFDPTRRLSRRDLLSSIDEFVADVERVADPRRETLVFFYFFGHGVADGISKSVFLVPETFVDDPNKKVAELAGQLIAIGDVAKKLAALTDRVIIFVDACRSHNNEAKQLVDSWRTDMRQDAQNLSNILDAIQFASGIFGPATIFFASEDGVAAPTVRLPNERLQSGTGPLAATLAAVTDEVATTGARLNLAQFIARITTPRMLGEPAARVQGHTFLRDRERDKFPDLPIISTDEQPSALRKQPFRPPGDGLESRLVAPLPRVPRRSNARAFVVGELAGHNIISQVAAAPDGSHIWVIDESQRVYAIRDGKASLINRDLPLMSIGWDRRFGLVGAQWDIPAFYRYANEQWVQLVEGTRVEFFVTSGNEQVFAIKGFGEYSSIGLRNSTLYEDRRFTSQELLDAAVTADGELWLVEADGVRRVGPVPARIAHGLWKPTIAAARGSYLYLLSQDARILYRLLDHDQVESVDLFDAGLGDSYVRSYGQRSLRILANGDALIAVGSTLVRVHLGAAAWTPTS